MVSTRRGTSGGPNQSIPQSTNPADNQHGLIPSAEPVNAVSLDPNLPGSSTAASPTVTLSLADLQKLLLDYQKQAFINARAELLAQSAAPPPPPPINIPPPVAAQNRPPPPAPAVERPSAPRMEGPADSTAHTPLASLQEVPPRNAEVPPRPRVQRPAPPPPASEEVAESTCPEERRPRTQANRDLPRDYPRERPPIRPELEEVSQQILQLSKKVEDLARGKVERPGPNDYFDAPRRAPRYEAPPKVRRERLPLSVKRSWKKGSQATTVSQHLCLDMMELQIRYSTS